MGSHDKIKNRSLLVFPIIVGFATVVVFFTGSVWGGKPKAGFVIKDAAVIYYNKAVFVSKSGSLAIHNIHGFEINPVYAIEKGRPGETVVFVHKFENLGNTGEKIGFKVISAPPGATVKIMIGKEVISGDLTVPEDAAFNLWFLCKLPVNARPDKDYTFKLRVSSREKDGDAYLGFDGRLHGGKDEITLIDRILL